MIKNWIEQQIYVCKKSREYGFYPWTKVKNIPKDDLEYIKEDLGIIHINPRKSCPELIIPVDDSEKE